MPGTRCASPVTAQRDLDDRHQTSPIYQINRRVISSLWVLHPSIWPQLLCCSFDSNLATIFSESSESCYTVLGQHVRVTPQNTPCLSSWLSLEPCRDVMFGNSRHVGESNLMLTKRSLVSSVARLLGRNMQRFQ